jgi:hypothetical protein
MKVKVGEGELFPFYVYDESGMEEIEIEIDEREYSLHRSIRDMFLISQARIEDLRNKALLGLEEA